MKKSNHLRLGVLGEKLAKRFLLRHGYFIWETNWRHKRGEIDIIASRNRRLSFIEVKTRRRSVANFAHPFESVTAAKKEQVSRLATSYVHHNGPQLRGRRVIGTRLELIAVILPDKWWKPWEKATIEHLCL